jgi:carboxylesterase
MTPRLDLDPSSFFLQGGPIGVLLIHGFTGAPTEMRLLGEYLNRNALTVSAPLLPGHGTSVEEMNRCRWTDWTGCVERALAELRTSCALVFVGGLSMGSLLTLYLAEHHSDLPGAIVYSPAVKIADWRLALTPLAKYFIRSLPKDDGDSDLTNPKAVEHLWSYDENPVAAAAELARLRREVAPRLPQVTCPLLIVYSTRDRAIHPDSAQFTYERASTPAAQKEIVTLHNSGHNLGVDSEWEFVASTTLEFILRHS